MDTEEKLDLVLAHVNKHQTPENNRFRVKDVFILSGVDYDDEECLWIAEKLVNDKYAIQHQPLSKGDHHSGAFIGLISLTVPGRRFINAGGYSQEKKTKKAAEESEQKVKKLELVERHSNIETNESNIAINKFNRKLSIASLIASVIAIIISIVALFK